MPEIDRIKKIFAANPAVIYTCRPSGDFGATFISENIKKQLGYKPEDFTENPSFWINNVHPGDKDRVIEGLTVLFEREEYSHEYRFRKPDGTFVWMRDELKLMIDPEGKPIEIIGSWLDISERKQVEDKLVYQQGLLEKSQELGKIGTWVFDVSQEVRCGTQETNNIFGTSVESSIKHETFLNMVHPEDKEDVAQKWDSILKGRATDFEYRIVIDNTLKHVRERMELEFNADGDVVKVIGVTQDITEMKALQEKAIRSAQLASTGELAAMVAHEVNNPLSGVIGYAQVFLNSACDDCRNKGLMERIIKEGERIAKIVGGLLTFSYDSGDKKTLQSLEPIVTDATNLISHHAEKTSVSIKTEMYDGLPYINCNSQQIEQVVINIVRNACQALIEGVLDGNSEKIIKIYAEEIEIDDQKFVQLSIANNGPNIPNELLPKIKERFFTTKPSGAGTGLGLSVTHDIMGTHGGSFEIRSEPGEWTEMVLNFPVEVINQGN